MQLIKQQYKYKYLSIDQRRSFLPKKNVCSIAPANEPSDYMLSGNGSHRVDVAGRPYDEEIIVTQEKLYEPLWDKTPMPADLRPYISDIRKYVLEGKPELADELITKAQREAGFDKYMKLDANIVYPTGAPQVHKAFSFNLLQKENGETTDYLRWTDLHTGKISTVWKNADGDFSYETLPAYDGDLVAVRIKAPKDKLNLELQIKLPGGPNMFGVPTMVGASHILEKTEELFTLSWAYNPENGKKGYVGLIRFVPEGGKLTVNEQGISISEGTSLVVLCKAVKIENNFEFGCEKKLAESFMAATPEFDALENSNRAVLGEKMMRSSLSVGAKDDYLLSGEELLERCHNVEELYPMMMDKLYDCGRFYQIIDTGELPPSWGQHNINTNLQVCAGNNTGLFDEMDVYFKFYESKFDDFRTNAKLLFNARGLLASVHCDYDSGLFYHFSKTYPHYCWTGCLGWIYNEFWGYYLCTGNQEFLKTRVVPALKEIALFFEDYACERDSFGKSVFVPSFSPEDPTPNPDYMTVTCKDIHPTRINSVMDVAICREVLNNLIEACETLDIEKESIPHWRKQLEELPVYMTDEEGALKEWAWDTIEENYNHRHVSHHYDLWPGRAVTLESEPEVAEAIRISNRKRGQQDDSAHGIIHRAFCAIRLKDQQEMRQNMGQLINHGFVRRNLTTAHFPYRGQFPDLQGAMPALLLEMCVQSRPGVIDFLPTLPECFKEGSIEGIWLYTWAKLERMEWKEGKLSAILKSNKAQDLSLRIDKNDAVFAINGEKLMSENGRLSYSFEKDKETLVEITW